MIKTLILTSEFPPQPGGIGNHAVNLAKGLQEAGFEVTVVSDLRSRKGIEEGEFDDHLPFRVVRIPHRKIALLRYIDRIRTAFFLAKQNEMVLCSGKFSLWVGGLLSFFFKKRFIAVIHGSELKLPNPLLKKLIMNALKRFDEVIAVSNYTKSLISHLKLKSVHIIPNGFELEAPEVCSIEQEPAPVLITVGNVVKRKGQRHVIKALPQLLKKYPDIKYHIVGIPTDQGRLEKLALDLKVGESLVFFGRISEAEKIEQLLHADIFVMLSQKTRSGDVEGFGIAILEANALGIPAIGALGCGIEDAIAEGVSGKLIENNDPQQFEAAITAILNDYHGYSERAKVWAENFTWEKVIERYLEILKRQKS